jgi:acetyl-CoA synthetase
VGPAEVESIILEQPGVADVAVVAAPDPRGGVTVRAVIVPDGSVGQDRLTISARDSVRARLGRHAYPRVVDFAGELPRTETGKLRRNVLRDSYQPGQAD